LVYPSHPADDPQTAVGRIIELVKTRKRLLKKYGYPPDLADDAVRLVLEQAEALLRTVG
jgi:hypothetical protein